MTSVKFCVLHYLIKRKTVWQSSNPRECVCEFPWRRLGLISDVPMLYWEVGSSFSTLSSTRTVPNQLQKSQICYHHLERETVSQMPVRAVSNLYSSHSIVDWSSFLIILSTCWEGSSNFFFRLRRCLEREVWRINPVNDFWSKLVFCLYMSLLFLQSINLKLDFWIEGFSRLCFLSSFPEHFVEKMSRECFEYYRDFITSKFINVEY